ncbi:unnamed protein product [Ranitomeya imitator]|uniref:Uncharacterized protein n=1 Tax=Ranitomeya imitator TaxID=111125 RepID=A0ABN9L269_9NEOB|nr:unnamed protein product [Ranitomeya imitator]
MQQIVNVASRISQQGMGAPLVHRQPNRSPTFNLLGYYHNRRSRSLVELDEVDPTVVDSRTCWGREFQRMGDIREKSWRRLDEERISVEERRRSWEDRRSLAGKQLITGDRKTGVGKTDPDHALWGLGYPRQPRPQRFSGRCEKKVEICDRQADEGTEGRKTEGNVRAETPPVHEDNSPEHGDGEEVEDYPMCSSPNPPLPRQSSSMHVAVMPPSCTVASSSFAVDAVLVSSTVVAASAAVSSSFVGSSRPTGLGAGSARPVPMVRAAPKKGKKKESSTSAIEAITS